LIVLKKFKAAIFAQCVFQMQLVALIIKSLFINWCN